ncbi:MAG: nicotinate-nucleotide diphosphorylase (carboxylating) [Dehalococcoidia bacterium]|nr:MAG: nicotinate-nucleotide diphosphorylase (carboxylating) [Dehalococcoidia bacterium]
MMFFLGEFLSRQDGVVSGLQVAALVFNALDKNVQFSIKKNDGEKIKIGETIATVRGSGRALLSGERVALNFLQRMSGISTTTSKFVDAIQGTKAKILDTRKTAPGIRVLDKLAVSLGGGVNHREGLYDMVLIKENHIEASGSISEAVSRVRNGKYKHLVVEVEVKKTLLELKETIDLEVDRILLDNMNLEDMTKSVRIVNGKVPLEASGNVTLANVKDVSYTGVDFISVGALTHSVKAMDISFLLNSQFEGRNS